MSLRRKLLASLTAVLALGAIAAVATFSAFSATSGNAGSGFHSGTVTIGDNDSGAQLLDVVGIKPLDTQTRCITVQYTGSLNAGVRVYGTHAAGASGNDLSPYLNVKIVRGSFPGAPPAGMGCTGFSADGGASTLFNDFLSALPTTYAAGVADSHTPWLHDETGVYQVTVTMPVTGTVDEAQGRDLAASFIFDARNLAA